MKGVAAAALCVCLIASGCTTSASPADIGYGAILRADIPLWRDIGDGAMWPRNFHSDTSFGCRHRIPLGLWRQTGEPDPETGGRSDPEWRRIDNYGLIHCAAVFSEGKEPFTGDLGYVIDLGRDDATGLHLLALQIGVRTGSTYELLAARTSADAGEERPPTRLLVLNADCSVGEIRGGDIIDIFFTEYCAVHSKRALKTIARRAARRPPVAMLEYVDQDEAATAPD